MINREAKKGIIGKNKKKNNPLFFISSICTNARTPASCLVFSSLIHLSRCKFP
jgi:hypothetical protein